MTNRVDLEAQLSTVLDKTFRLIEKKINENAGDYRNIGQKQAFKKVNTLFIQMKLISAILLTILLAINFTFIYYLLIRRSGLHESVAIGIVVIVIAVTISLIVSEGSGYKVIRNLVMTMKQEIILSHADILSFEDRLGTTKSVLFVSQITKALGIISRTCYVNDEDKAYIRGLSLQLEEIGVFEADALECLTEYKALLHKTQNSLEENQTDLEAAVDIRDVQLPSNEAVLDQKRTAYSGMGGIKQQEAYVNEKAQALEDHQLAIKNINEQIQVYDNNLNRQMATISKSEEAIANLNQEIETSQKNMQEQILDLTKQKQKIEKDLLNFETSSELESLQKSYNDLEKKRDNLVEKLKDADVKVQFDNNEELVKVATKISQISEDIFKERTRLRGERTELLNTQSQLVAKEQLLNQQKTKLDNQNARHTTKINSHKEELIKLNEVKNSLILQKAEEVQKQLDETHRMSVSENKYDELLAPFIQLQKEINILENAIANMNEHVSKIDFFEHAIASAEHSIRSYHDIIIKLDSKLTYYDEETKLRTDLIEKLRKPFL